MSTETTVETHGFQTEAKQLLKLMIHSLYSNREIFLRELISNASDAIDKLRFKAISQPDLAGSDSDFAIRVDFDEDAKTLTVSDNGVGMTRQEVIDHLGTIARSGTAEFLNTLTGDQKQDTALIGQFGVGFYSVFIVADEVEVFTRGAGTDQATRWVSKGEDEFTVEDAQADRGTRVVLHLRADAQEFANEYRLRNIVTKYSDHIGTPVKMLKPDFGSEEDASADKKAEEPVWETVNAATALWTRSRSELTDEEYQAFYKHLSHDFEDALDWSHNKVEGKLEYTSLLYLPKKAPFDLWNRDVPRGLKLYVQRVFIMDQAEQFLPLYLRFVKGVIDSNDLPLNVSREILQEDDRVTNIRNALTKRVLGMLESMAKKQPDKYQEFIDSFGEVLKEGAGEDFANRETLIKLLRFSSTHTGIETKNVAIADYVERLKEGQKKIYYLTAESFDNAFKSPHLEIFKSRDIEVLLLFDRIDEWLTQALTTYKDYEFQDVMRGDLDLPGEEAATDKQDEAASPLTTRIKEALNDNVEGVRVSKRLTDSPACLVLGEFAMGAQMRKILEASGQQMPESKPYFEYNAEHPLVKRLDAEQDEDRFADLVMILFDQASLAEGGTLKDASAYVNRLNSLLMDLMA